MAATVAASPSPKLVPLTRAVALAMIASTLFASLPRPRSLAEAVSMALSRLNPAVSAVPMPAMPTVTAPVAMPLTALPTPLSALPTAPMALDALLAMPWKAVRNALPTPLAAPWAMGASLPNTALAAEPMPPR